MTARSVPNQRVKNTSNLLSYHSFSPIEVPVGRFSGLFLVMETRQHPALKNYLRTPSSGNAALGRKSLLL